VDRRTSRDPLSAWPNLAHGTLVQSYLRLSVLLGPVVARGSAGVVQIARHSGELFPRIGCVVTNLKWRSRRVVRSCNKSGTAKRLIKGGKNALNWTELSCRQLRNNAAWLRLFSLDENLAIFLPHLVLPKPVWNWSLPMLHEKLNKIGGYW
jgi:hypothetical protein